MKTSLLKMVVVGLVTHVGAANAQNYVAEPQIASGKFTTATEIKAILPYTKAQWIAVRPYNGKDLLYFTNLLAWRCGLHEIRFSVNGGALQVLDAEPCYADEPAPNALKTDGGILPFVEFPENTIVTVTLELLYDDMSVEQANYDRASVQIQ